MFNKIGVDITKNCRFESYIDNLYKLKKILSDQEIKYLQKVSSSKRKLEFIASRFACKEALFKACNIPFSFNNVSVLNEENGAPYIVCDFLETDNVKVSISHEEEYSIAFVLINN